MNAVDMDHDTGRAPGGPTALFLDFYGTITNLARETIEEVCERVMRDVGIDGEAGELAVEWGRRFFRLIERSNHDRFRTLYECERDSFIELMDAMGHRLDGNPIRAADGYIRPLLDYLSHPPIHEDVFEVLEQLDVPICLVTNADRDDVMTATRHYGLDFDEIVTSEEARCYKPEAGIFELALDRTGWSREQVIHAGDSRHSDVDGANRLGITSVLIDRAGRVSDVGNAEPNHTFPDLRGLLTLF
ncbi:MAG: HAD family hydrolase [Phycisphaerae bacterium]|nr:HAD family hydrolase [Phycisphaerae bacterium]